MARYVIVGAGPSGLYVAYRLLTSGRLTADDRVDLYEWNPSRVGGRIHTYRFPGAGGQYFEAGGMRLAADAGFPDTIEGGHVLVQQMIRAMGLADAVVPFDESPSRLYYLRGTAFYENHIPNTRLPYNFDPSFVEAGYQSLTADGIVAAIAGKFAPGSHEWSRQRWCEYFSRGTVPAGAGTAVFPEGTSVRNIGYWNLLYDQLGDQGFDYVADANGYQSNVINWNAADAQQANTDFGSSVAYSRIQGGYSLLFDAMRAAIEGHRGAPVAFHFGHRLVSFARAAEGFTCRFTRDDGSVARASADHLFLAMPRRALELVAAGCEVDNALNREPVRLYLESAIDQPAFRVGMLFEDAWWSDPELCATPPQLQPDGAGGPTITDLPLRQAFYFGNDASLHSESGPYVILASYDDMQYSDFWRVMEATGDYRAPPSRDTQPLTGPTALPRPMQQMLMGQLARVHGAHPEKIPEPLQSVYMDWGLDPFGGGYHAWAAHYDICTAMTKMRAPGREILGDDSNLFVVGSCYSFDQAWVEGAFCVAESVLRDYLGLEPFCALPEGYALICKG